MPSDDYKNSDDEKPCSSSKIENDGHVKNKDDRSKESRSRSSSSQSSAMSTYGDICKICAKTVQKKKKLRKKSVGRKRGPFRKKRNPRRLTGKVEKRGRLPKKGPVRRAGVTRKRDPSMCTIFSKISRNTSSRSVECKYCGHRCCLRRWMKHLETLAKRTRRKRTYKRKRINNKRPRKRRRLVKWKPTVSRSIQIGSRCPMLSPLYIERVASPDQPCASTNYTEISPEMIYESLKRLTLWKEAATTASICKYIKEHYPVNPDDDVLMIDLLEKLRIALLADLVTSPGDDTWMLSCRLQRKRFERSHVTLFWEAYMHKHIMQPLIRDRHPKNAVINENEDEDDVDKTDIV